MTSTTRREAMALISGALAGTALGGNALAQGTPKRGGILRISAPANPSSLDPATGGAGSDHAFLFTMYDTLTEWDFETLKPKPGLAESWSFTDPTTLGAQYPFRRHLPRRHAARCRGRQIQSGAQQERPEIQHQGRSRLDGVRRGHRSDAGHAEAEHARRRAARHPFRPRRHDGVADRAQGCQRRQCHAHAGRRRGLCFRELGGRREDRRQAQREILEAQPSVSGWNRVLHHSGTDDRLALGHRRPERPDVPTAAAPEGDHGPRPQRQDRQRADALCLPDFPELGEAAVRQCQGPPGLQFRDRPRDLRQGGARRPCRTRLHEPAESALGLRQVRRRALSP